MTPRQLIALVVGGTSYGVLLALLVDEVWHRDGFEPADFLFFFLMSGLVGFAFRLGLGVTPWADLRAAVNLLLIWRRNGNGKGEGS